MNVLRVAFGAMALMAAPYFLLLNLRTTLGLLLATLLMMGLVWPLITATLGTLTSELFRAELRYTGISLGYQIGAAVVGGTAPLVATWLLAVDHGSWRWIACYVAVLAALSALAVSVSGHRAKDLA